MKKRSLITENDVVTLAQSGKNTLYVEKGALFTPAAKDKIHDLKIEVVEKSESPDETRKYKNSQSAENFTVSGEGNMKLALGSDHTGYETKEALKGFLSDLGYSFVDVGTNSTDSCDYPDFAFEAAKKVALGEVSAAIVFDATGIPSAITANKIPGIRAATCYNEFSAQSSREHNNANVLVLGAKSLGIETIKSIIKVWLSTGFLGERHQRRLNKIAEIEKMFLNRNGR